MKRTNIACLILSILLLNFSHYCFSQDRHNTKPWKAKIFSGGVKFKGILFEVTDSSVVILLPKAASQDEILFADIDIIKLVPHHGKGKKRLVGFAVGSIAGAWSVSSGLSKGKTGEPAALAGVIGGIGGGLIGATVGVAIAPSVYNLFAIKKFSVEHDPRHYHLLKLKLQPYTIKRQ